MTKKQTARLHTTLHKHKAKQHKTTTAKTTQIIKQSNQNNQNWKGKQHRTTQYTQTKTKTSNKLNEHHNIHQKKAQHK